MENSQATTGRILKELKRVGGKYAEKAGKLKKRVDTALTHVWDETLDLAKTVRRHHGPKVRHVPPSQSAKPL